MSALVIAPSWELEVLADHAFLLRKLWFHAQDAAAGLGVKQEMQDSPREGEG